MISTTSPISKCLMILMIGCLLSLEVNQVSSDNACNYEIVESMPDKLVFNKTMSFKPTVTGEALLTMMDNAKKTLRIASFYMTLTPEQPEFIDHPSAKPGEHLLAAIINAKGRGVDVQVILDHSSNHPMSNPKDVARLEAAGIPVKWLDMKKVAGGVLHTKFMIADNKTLYVGSSNFDWRSYTQIKEIGIKFNDCEVLSSDLDKIFQIYAYVSDKGKVPAKFPEYLNTKINIDQPLSMAMNSVGEHDEKSPKAELYLASSPPEFNGKTNWTGRTDDIDGLLSVIDGAKQQIDISVMNYGPRTAFIWPKKYWPRIDDALRRAATTRGVQVRLLFSKWVGSKPEEIIWYKSLDALRGEGIKGNGIKVKLFQVPAYDDFQKKVPYARVKHDKYMVADNGLYIGTSNWTPDYFINTCGVSYVIKPREAGAKLAIIGEMQELFQRDFTSAYAHDL